MAAPASAGSDPSPSRGRRLWLHGLIAAAVFVAMVAAVAPWAFSNAALRAEIAAQIRHLSGLAAMSQGHAVFVVLPQPHISVDEVRFADPAGGLRIDARYLKAYLRLTSLLTGRLDISSVTLGQPEIEVDLDVRESNAQPHSSDTVIGRAVSAIPGTSEAETADRAGLGTVTLIDGHVRLKGGRFPSDLSIGGINVTLDWQKVGSAVTVSGQARVHGEAAEIAAWIANPAGLLRGQRSALSLKIDAPSFSIAAAGGLATIPKWQFGGRLRASAPSLRSALEQAGYLVPLPGPFTNFDASCEATIDLASAVFSGLRLRFDGNDFEGTLAFQAREKGAALSGTLATGQLSLRPLLSSLPDAVGRDGQWNREPFDLQKYGATELDLRISAAHMLFSHFELEDAAFSLMRSGDRAELTLAGAKAYQGTVKGRARVDFRDGGIGVQVSGVVSGADLAALSFDALGWPQFYGSLTGTLSLESVGSSMRELMHNLDGTATADVGKGQIAGIDLESAVRRLDKSPLALLTDVRRGRTAFDRASFGLRFVNGLASIEDGQLDNPAVRLAFGGTVDFGERGLDLHAVATSPNGGEKMGKDPADFRFDITGSWDDLAFNPDVRSLIRRSGAAAPLLPRQPDGAASLGLGGNEAAR